MRSPSKAPTTAARRPGLRSRRPPAHPRIALALAGGGPLGAIYEIGALCALSESLQGLDFNDLDHYVGVSAGGFIAAGPQREAAALLQRSAFDEPDASQLPLVEKALAGELDPAARVVTILCDRAERYYSTKLFKH